MSPASPHITCQLRQLIYYHLDCNLLRNALFLAGRLHAYEPRSSEAAYLLALCHLRLGQLRAAYDASRTLGSRGTHPGCSYVFAQACLGLERYQDGLTAIDRSKGYWISRSNWSMYFGNSPQSRISPYVLILVFSRQAHRHKTATSPGRCGILLLTSQALARAPRHKQGNRMLCRGLKAESLHVGCFSWTLRLGYGFCRLYDRSRLKLSRGQRPDTEYLQNDRRNDKCACKFLC